ncbi:protein translocase subunit SecF [Candidatus Pelagibacter sp.]|nr:protein translocase subunit SecF [Candidatus Pelagibacter sp.]|tara:strand:+ start:593 stop:1492 length:900 start_codon:yes stop_codon:yes gene_type:complete
MNHIKFNKFYSHFGFVSLGFILISLFFLFFKGLNYGVDFKGGTLIEVRIDTSNHSTSKVRDVFSNLNLSNLTVKNFGNNTDYIIKFQKENLDNPEFINNLKIEVSKSFPDINFRRVENVGPKVSSELLKSGIIAISLSLAAMLFYIWIRFEWQFSLGAIVALFHDVIITLGIFSFLSLEINLSIVAAVLTIVGYSMNDTVVIYDRVRDNLKKYIDLKIFDLTNLSINETLSRTILTSITTLMALLSIFFLGGEILKGFSFAMILGVLVGTYSSIYIANPILVKLNVNHYTVVKKEENKN